MFSNILLTLIALSSHLSLVTAQTTNAFIYPPGGADAGSVNPNVTFEIGTIVTLLWETDFSNVTLTAFQGLWQGAYSYKQLLNNVPTPSSYQFFVSTVNSAIPYNVPMRFELKVPGASPGIPEIFNLEPILLVQPVSSSSTSLSTSSTTLASASSTSAAVRPSSPSSSSSLTASSSSMSSQSSASSGKKVSFIGVGLGLGLGIPLSVLLRGLLGYWLRKKRAAVPEPTR